jgi:CubicO group peptidase (beta-lactamase class C family)
MNGKERYYIYSCSKVITCAAALQLWEQGKFRLTDKLSDYMPEFAEMYVQTEEGLKKAENPILITHLFEMTAGFSYDMVSPAVRACQAATDGQCPTREFMKYLAKEPLLFHPGEKYKYSLCHDVLACLIEVIEGVPVQDYMKQHIFDPVGMKDTSYMAAPICMKYRYNAAENRFQKLETNGYRIGPAYASGGAGAVSTVEDYMRMLEALRTFQLLKPETVQLMMTPRLTLEQLRENFPAVGSRNYGLGVRVPIDTHPHTEFGWGGAAGAFWSVDMTHKMSIYYAQHVTMSPNNDLRGQIYALAFDELTGLKTSTVERNEKLKNITY